MSCLLVAGRCVMRADLSLVSGMVCRAVALSLGDGCLVFLGSDVLLQRVVHWLAADEWFMH